MSFLRLPPGTCHARLPRPWPSPSWAWCCWAWHCGWPGTAGKSLPRMESTVNVALMAGLDLDLVSLLLDTDGGRAAHHGTAVAAHLPVGGQYVHPFPRVLPWKPLCGDRYLARPTPSPHRARIPRQDTLGAGLLTGHQRGFRPGRQW